MATSCDVDELTKMANVDWAREMMMLERASMKILPSLKVIHGYLMITTC